jgi:3-hydroxyisobutyrate dehydrogenase-like beta-hydroxyacid dehydrogenase
MTIRCGFIGLGIMGKALAGNLAPKGLPTIVYDIDEAAIRELLASGAKPAQSIREVAQNADVIGICVPADSHVRAVLCGEEGVFAHAAAGAVVAIHSTVHPSTIEEMAAEGASRGVAVLEAPVAGGPVRAAQGDAFYMVSGDEAAYEKARPYLEAAAGKIIFTGAFGNAAKLKLALNVLTNLSFAASLEAMLLAKAMGLPQELFEEGGRTTGMLNAPTARSLRCRRRRSVGRSPELLAGHGDRLVDLGRPADGPRAGSMPVPSRPAPREGLGVYDDDLREARPGLQSEEGSGFADRQRAAHRGSLSRLGAEQLEIPRRADVAFPDLRARRGALRDRDAGLRRGAELDQRRAPTGDLDVGLGRCHHHHFRGADGALQSDSSLELCHAFLLRPSPFPISR